MALSWVRRFFRIAGQAAKLWFQDNAFMHSAAVSFYMLFSLVPVTFIALRITAFFFGFRAAHGELASELAQLIGRGSAELISKAVVAAVPRHRGWPVTAVGVALVLFGATAVFAQLQESLNSIWGVAARPSRRVLAHFGIRRLVSLGVALAVSFLLLLSMALSTVTAAAFDFVASRSATPLWAIRGIDLGIGFLVTTLLFAVVFKVLPEVVVTWRDAWRGAVLTSVLFSVGRILIAVYVGHSMITSAYGTAGSLAALLVSVYYSSAIMFYGVEFMRCHRLEHGLRVVPKSTAVLVRKHLVEDPES